LDGHGVDEFVFTFAFFGVAEEEEEGVGQGILSRFFAGWVCEHRLITLLEQLGQRLRELTQEETSRLVLPVAKLQVVRSGQDDEDLAFAVGSGGGHRYVIVFSVTIGKE